MSAVLVERQSPTAGLSKVIHQIHKLEAIEQDVIGLLPKLSDDEVMETRTTARLLFASAWKIEIACDNEIWDRTEKAVRGRGNKDVDEKGIMAAVNKRAEELGCGASTILKNAQIFKRFKNTLTSESHLDEKGFFLAALSAPDPDAAIEDFSQKKLDNPYFRVTDAWKQVETQKENAKQARERVAGGIRDTLQDLMIAHIDKSIALQQQLKLECPLRRIGDRLYDSMIEDLEDVKQNIQLENVETAIERAIKDGYGTILDLAGFTGLSQLDVRRAVKKLIEKDIVEIRSIEESRQDGRRGVMVDLYAIKQK